MNKDQLIEQINNPTTKWAEYFKRFYENHTELFWKFYELNHVAWVDISSGSEFQILWEQIEMELWKLENILTSRQIWWRSTEKTVTAFYDLVESYFPLFGKIE